MVRKVNRINRPDFDAQALQREYRCTVSDMPVNDAGLDGEDVQTEWSDGVGAECWSDEVMVS